jgi:hypothetical protein
MNFSLVGIVVSFVLSGVIFVATQNVFSTILIFFQSLLFFVLIVARRMKKNQLKIHRYHQCYQFINTFIVSLNVKGSMNAAIESSYETSDEGTREVLDSIKEMNEEEKIVYLTKYFKFDLYRLFVDTIKLWNEEGGDILRMSQYLVNQVRLKEQYLLTCETIHRQKTIEFTVLWSISLAILAVLRFALSQFFYRINNTLFYQISVVVIILFVLFSVYILLLRASAFDLEGWKDDEK